MWRGWFWVQWRYHLGSPARHVDLCHQLPWPPASLSQQLVYRSTPGPWWSQSCSFGLAWCLPFPNWTGHWYLWETSCGCSDPFAQPDLSGWLLCFASLVTDWRTGCYHCHQHQTQPENLYLDYHDLVLEDLPRCCSPPEWAQGHFGQEKPIAEGWCSPGPSSRFCQSDSSTRLLSCCWWPSLDLEFRRLIPSQCFTYANQVPYLSLWPSFGHFCWLGWLPRRPYWAILSFL